MDKNRLKLWTVRLGAGSLAGVAMVAAYASSSFAAVDPSVGAAITGGFTDMTSLLVGTLVPALFGIAIIGIGVKLGLKYLRKGSSS